MGRYLDIARRVIAEQDAQKIRKQLGEAGVLKPPPVEGVPALPRGVRLVHFEPKAAPVILEVASVVTDVRKFIEAELGELDARLHSPVQIRGGGGVFTILERLRQVGLELVLEPSLENPQPSSVSVQEVSQGDFRTPGTDGGAS